MMMKAKGVLLSGIVLNHACSSTRALTTLTWSVTCAINNVASRMNYTVQSQLRLFTVT